MLRALPTLICALMLACRAGAEEAVDIAMLSAKAEAGDVSAMCDLGQRYYLGTGVEKDSAKALAWYERGAQAGHAKSMMRLGLMYALAAGVAKDDATAI